MYLIPRNISKRFEFFPGWGWRELVITLIALGIAVIIVFLLGLFISSPIRYLPGLFVVALGYLCTQPVMPDGSSALDMLKYLNRFRRGRKLYLYEKGGL